MPVDEQLHHADGTLAYWFCGHELVIDGGQAREIAGCKLWSSCGPAILAE